MCVMKWLYVEDQPYSTKLAKAKIKYSTSYVVSMSAILKAQGYIPPKEKGWRIVTPAIDSARQFVARETLPANRFAFALA